MGVPEWWVENFGPWLVGVLVAGFALYLVIRWGVAAGVANAEKKARKNK